jgi:hypothetical protein
VPGSDALHRAFAAASALALLVLIAVLIAGPAEAGTLTASTATAGPQLELPRETPIETPLGNGPVLKGSAFGGYGELTLNARSDSAAVVDLRRVVFFFGHNFNEHFRFYSELEIEHAVASSSQQDKGEVEIEQAYLDVLLDKHLNFRGGVVIMPVGIINVYHEPPSFNGVDRPLVDTYIIPSTWREPGIGIFGELVEGLRYQLFLVNGLNANGFHADKPIFEGHQEADLAHAGDFGGVFRLDFEPSLGVVLGASAYFATSGNSLEPQAGHVPVGMVEADVRLRRGGLMIRGELALLYIGGAAELNHALQNGSSDQMTQGPVASSANGAYAEIGYDIFHPLLPDSGQALIAFVRWDHVDPQWSLPDPIQPRLDLRLQAGTFGLVYKPIPEIALKADLRRHHTAAGANANEIASAITWMF